MTDDPPRQTLKSVEQAFDVIETLQEMNGCGVTEMANQLGIPKSTAHIYLSTLERKGYLVKEDDVYQLSLRFLNLGEYTKRMQELSAVIDPPLENLAESSHGTAICGVEQHGLLTVLASKREEQTPPESFPVGAHWYLHSNASGKAILSQYSISRVDAIVDKWGLSSVAPNTIESRDALLEELDETRSRGYAINDEESMAGVGGIGVPLVKDDGQCFGSISISGPKNNVLKDKLREEHIDLIERAANTVEVNLTWE
ncbi:IclR family transcriptional regulator [Halorarius halobius]|uniref:IclR family transcriptional regulator n=1 Tax=Halorarius halobius TaxID=2962671 RepID=UPI0020CC39D6|nr:IclR family transcriptional regulator [Halorarius halobius]